MRFLPGPATSTAIPVINVFKRRLGTELFVAPQQPDAIQGPRELLHHFASWKLVSEPSVSNRKPGLRSTRSKSECRSK